MRFGTGTSDQRIEVQLIYNVLCPFTRLPFGVIQFYSPLCDRRFSLYTMVQFPGTDRHPFGTDTTGQTIEVQRIVLSLCSCCLWDSFIRHYVTPQQAVLVVHNDQVSGTYTVIRFE